MPDPTLLALPAPPKLPKRGEAASQQPEYAEFMATGHVRFAESDEEAPEEPSQVGAFLASFRKSSTVLLQM